MTSCYLHFALQLCHWTNRYSSIRISPPVFPWAGNRYKAHRVPFIYYIPTNNHPNKVLNFLNLKRIATNIPWLIFIVPTSAIKRQVTRKWMHNKIAYTLYYSIFCHLFCRSRRMFSLEMPLFYFVIFNLSLLMPFFTTLLFTNWWLWYTVYSNAPFCYCW